MYFFYIIKYDKSKYFQNVLSITLKILPKCLEDVSKMFYKYFMKYNMLQKMFL